MAIKALTGFKALQFDGETSTDYGVQILGEGVFNAPEREVEMISIPGRNGSFALDKGRFENIDVTYPANIIADSTADFAAAISDFRNMLCSRRGYCRLTDDYNPDEYRMAVYKSGLEVDEKVLRAGDFEIVFDCKPQRYLMSGEAEISVSDGDTILNPTLFEAKPMLEVEGYGDINIGNSKITLENITIGEALLVNGKTETGAASTVVCEIKVKTTGYESGDDIYTKATKGLISANCSVRGKTGYSADYTTPVYYWFPTVVAGTASSTSQLTRSRTVNVKNISTGTTETAIVNESTQFTYDGVDTFTCTNVITLGGDGKNHIEIAANNATINTLYVDSSASALGNPTYIDLDIGEAYMVVDGEVISLNNTVALPANLPELAPGANEITFDDTITDLKVIPRWWKI